MLAQRWGFQRKGGTLWEGWDRRNWNWRCGLSMDLCVRCKSTCGCGRLAFSPLYVPSLNWHFLTLHLCPKTQHHLSPCFHICQWVCVSMQASSSSLEACNYMYISLCVLCVLYMHCVWTGTYTTEYIWRRWVSVLTFHLVLKQCQLCYLLYMPD